ncbi:MAG: EAL domain-containing protein [Anaerolineales bacterium]|nr:EAL domain-containing protein [Anaerolineales bacterium]
MKWIKTSWNALILPHPRIRDDEIRISSRLLSILLVLLLPTACVFLAALSIGFGPTDQTLSPDFLIFGTLMVIMAGIYWVNRMGYFDAAIMVTLFIGGLAILLEAVIDRDMGDLAFLVLPMIIASLFLSIRRMVLLSMFYLGGTVLLPFVFPEIYTETIIKFALPMLVLGIVLTIISRLHRDYLEAVRNDKIVASELRYSLSADAVNDGLWDWDHVNNRVYYSSRWKEMIGYKPDEITDALEEWLSRIHPDDKEDISRHLNQPGAASLEEPFEMEYRFRHKNGTYIWVLTRGRSNYDAHGTLLRTIGSHTDITTRKEAEEKLSFDALHDHLTGLSNRALFNEKLNQVIKLAKKDSSLLYAVLFLDLDDFKDINDSMGHEAGDEVLKHFSLRILSVLFEVDTLARLGGDEFVILLESLDSPQRPLEVVQRIQETLNKPFFIHDSNIYLTVSTGVVIGAQEYSSSDEIMRDADIAMYHAKSLGKNTFEIFNINMREQILNRLNLERELRQAIQNKEFLVEYQPITDLNTTKLLGFEALVRWNHPRRGLILPGEFIPIAEQTGLILPIGEWVFETACRQMKAWEEKYPSTKALTISINVSGKQLNHARFYKTVAELLEDVKLEPRRVNLEITETSILEDNPETHNSLMELAKLGLNLQLDDFGTGQSSLSHLQKYPLSEIKIDRSFVALIDKKREYGLVNGIIQLARALELKTIAEGIESKKQEETLKSLNCDSGQGFGIHTPVSADRIDSLLREQDGKHDLFLPVNNYSI